MTQFSNDLVIQIWNALVESKWRVLIWIWGGTATISEDSSNFALTGRRRRFEFGPQTKRFPSWPNKHLGVPTHGLLAPVGKFGGAEQPSGATAEWRRCRDHGRPSVATAGVNVEHRRRHSGRAVRVFSYWSCTYMVYYSNRLMITACHAERDGGLAAKRH